MKSRHTLRPLAQLLATVGFLSLPAFAQAQISPTALPSGGVVSAGSAAITQAGNALRIDQASNKAVIDWASFNIGRDAAVRFNQPSASAIALNRVGADGGRSLINGQLSANGQVWLLNPGGAIFGPNARVDVGGLLASTLKLGNDDFLAGNYRFSKDGNGAIINQGTLTAAQGGYIALLAPEVRNEGVIAARLGTVALASGEELRVDFTGDRLIEIAVDKAAVDGLIENRNLIEAEGGLVLMSTDAANRLAHGAANNTGIIRAQTFAEHEGVIKLLGGTTTVAGTLDASAPAGGNGGFIETSGHTVNIAPDFRVTTRSTSGKSGLWLIDPNDFTIAATGGNMTGAQVVSALSSGNFTIQTSTMGTAGGNGDIFVNDAVNWSTGNEFRLVAERNVTINSVVAGTGINSIFNVTAPGLLTVNANVTAKGNGSIGAQALFYNANEIALNAITTAIGGSLDVKTVTANRSIRIEDTPTAGVLSISPAALQKLHADANQDVGPTTQDGNITVASAIASNQISAGRLYLQSNTGSVIISAPISGGTAQGGVWFDAGSGVTINAAVSTPGKVTVQTPGTLTVTSNVTGTGPGGAGGEAVTYQADTMALSGSTTAVAGTVTVRPFTASRSIYIEFSPTAGVLSLTPTQFASLHADNNRDILVYTPSGNIWVTAPLTSSQIDAGALTLKALGGGNLTVDASISGGTVLSGIRFEGGAGVTINAGVSTPGVLMVDTPATFTLTGFGSVNAADVGYHADDMNLIGSTTTTTESIGLSPYTSSRNVLIATTPTAGVLNLSPAEIATLHAPATRNINIGNPVGSGTLTVETAITSSHMNNSDNDLHLKGGSVIVNAPISFAAGGSGLVFESGSGGVQLNAPVTLTNAYGVVNFILSGGGGVSQSSSAPLTAKSMYAGGDWSGGQGNGFVDLDSASGGNSVAAVAGNLSGSFWINNGSQSITVTSLEGANGIRAGYIGLNTDGNLTLNAPLVATGAGTVSVGPSPKTDPLCTGPCVRPHIELSTDGTFSNAVGANALSVQPGKFWMLKAERPGLTTLNGLTPDHVSYDRSSLSGADVLLSANRVFYRSQDPAPSSGTPSMTATTSVETVVNQQSTTTTASTTPTTTQVAATAPVGGTGSGGASMSNFPVQSSAPSTTTTSSTATATATQTTLASEPEPPPPPPKLVVEASKSMPRLAGVLSRADLQAISQQIKEARTQLFGDALARLAQDPRAADIGDCSAGGGDLCIATPKVVGNDYLPIVKRKIAVLIGNNSYRSPIPDLETAVNDVSAIGNELRDKLGYEVKVIQNAGRKDIVDALNDLIRNTDRDDSVMVMYAGHGYLQENTKAGYWIPSDADATNPEKWISNDTIAKALGNIPAKQVMLVSDSCYSGSLTKEGKVTETVGINREQTLTRRSVLALSSGGEEPVSDEGHDNHSIFAWNMIQTLKQAKSELPGQQLHATIKAAVTKDFPQEPQYGTILSAGHADGGEYLLTPKR